MQHLRRHNFQALQDMDLGDGTNSIGLILSKVYHKAANKNQVFDRADRALKAYNPSIWDDDNNAACLRQEKNWSRNLDCQVAIRIANRIGKKLVLSRVEETWVV